eukprot:Gregarina_sp_Poly_1__7800@NODE_4414_length_605_cov_366_206320_g31_i1_p1_GENE_NODE_4414_length_605_cov_366_206320_g31_i1NODE_4414_length_605_cov_366_206320_g31_i1_p1_ORF_typecomplete_len124_score12_96DUF1439/PF07273_12/0_17_NODE_4414_length_605_cov_366_206320_g31_i1131502
MHSPTRQSLYRGTSNSSLHVRHATCYPISSSLAYDENTRRRHFQPVQSHEYVVNDDTTHDQIRRNSQSVSGLLRNESYDNCWMQQEPVYNVQQVEWEEETDCLDGQPFSQPAECGSGKPFNQE